MFNMFAAMFLAPSILHAAPLLLMQVIVINVVKSEYSTQHNNETNDAYQSKPGRFKRSLYNDMPSLIKIQIQYSTEELINLQWIKQDQYLANEHLPVVMSSGYVDLNVMDSVGEFIIYRDLEKCSSVVYFKKLNALFGDIGMGYFIVSLPYKYDVITGYYPEVVGAPYVMRRENAPIYLSSTLANVGIERSYQSSSSGNSNRGIKRPLEYDEGLNSKTWDHNEENEVGNVDAKVSEIGNIEKTRYNPLTQQYYLENLVFITRGIVEKFKKSPQQYNYIEWIVRYSIIYFNAVDMMFQKMRTINPRMHINIGKIVIEDEIEPFHFINNGEIQFTGTFRKLRDDLKIHQHVYTPDSFDHVFVISLPIKDDLILAPGKTQYGTDLYEARKQDRFYDAVPITIMDHMASYAFASHEISRSLGIKIDLPIEEAKNSVQCSSVMQKGSSKCDGCLKWSRRSEKQYQAFFRENRDRCFLVNEPRSLRPPGPSKFLSPHKQCLCFGYKSYITMADHVPKGYLMRNECSVPLQCKKIDGDRSYYESTLMPFDGTVCGDRRKVCWNGKCTLLESEVCMNLQK